METPVSTAENEKSELAAGIWGGVKGYLIGAAIGLTIGAVGGAAVAAGLVTFGVLTGGTALAGAGMVQTGAWLGALIVGSLCSVSGAISGSVKGFSDAHEHNLIQRGAIRALTPEMQQELSPEHARTAQQGLQMRVDSVAMDETLLRQTQREQEALKAPAPPTVVPLPSPVPGKYTQRYLTERASGHEMELEGAYR